MRFLRHIERTQVLAFLIPIDSDNPKETYDLLRKEIESYSEELSRRPHCVVFTKKDLNTSAFDIDTYDFPAAWGVFEISSVSRIGIDLLLESVWGEIQEAIQVEVNSAEEDFWDF